MYVTMNEMFIIPFGLFKSGSLVRALVVIVFAVFGDPLQIGVRV